MSYNVSAHYSAETHRKNRLKALHKPTVGILSGFLDTLILVANSKTTLILNQNSKYSEHENRIRHQYHIQCACLLWRASDHASGI
jgi:hypothetical protein